MSVVHRVMPKVDLRARQWDGEILDGDDSNGFATAREFLESLFHYYSLFKGEPRGSVSSYTGVDRENRALLIPNGINLREGTRRVPVGHWVVCIDGLDDGKVFSPEEFAQEYGFVEPNPLDRGPNDAYQDAVSCDSRNPDWELLISTDGFFAGQYAANVLKGRFKLGEPAIAKDALWAHDYAVNALKGRFEFGEAVIATDARLAYLYAKDVIKGRWELGEPAIATSTESSYRYAKDVLHGRFELGEEVIFGSDSPYRKAVYRKEFLGGE